MSTAVMARRVEPPDSLDFFPTPPWAARALVECVDLADDLSASVMLEPAAGEGHIAETLREYFADVIASDVFDYGKGYEVASYIGEGLDVRQHQQVDWTISNPPFNAAEQFVCRALKESRKGVAMLLRTSWLESGGRYHNVFNSMPPSTVAVFVERVPMHKGRWDPDGASATSYAWFVWRHPLSSHTKLVWIPPGQRHNLHRQTDVVNFCKPTSTSLLEAS